MEAASQHARLWTVEPRSLGRALAVATLLLAAAVSAPALELTGDFGGRFESNASNSDVPGDREAEFFLGGRIRAGTSGVLARDWRWQAGIFGEGEAATRFAELGFFEAGPIVGLERKLGLGWQAPRLQLDALFAARTAGQAGASGLHFTPSLAIVFPAGERWGASVRYRPDWLFARSPVFTSAGHEVSTTAWFDVFPSTRLSLTYAFRHGDVISYALPPRPDLAQVAIAQADTRAFGAERIVYRVVAATHRLEGRLVQKLTEKIDLRASYAWETTQGPAGLDYQNHIVEFSFNASL